MYLPFGVRTHKRTILIPDAHPCYQVSVTVLFRLYAGLKFIYNVLFFILNNSSSVQLKCIIYIWQCFTVTILELFKCTCVGSISLSLIRSFFSSSGVLIRQISRQPILTYTGPRCCKCNAACRGDLNLNIQSCLDNTLIRDKCCLDHVNHVVIVRRKIYRNISTVQICKLRLTYYSGVVFCCFVFLFFSVRLVSVLRGHSFFSSPPQRPMPSDFEGNYWYHFYNVFGMTRSLTGY